LTQRELSYFAGCSHTTVSLLERGEIDVSVELKTKIARALGVPVQELWASGLDEEPESEPAA
jgi:DNA-binding XRE family transcriptional regulator